MVSHAISYVHITPASSPHPPLRTVGQSVNRDSFPPHPKLVIPRALLFPKQEFPQAKAAPVGVQCLSGLLGQSFNQ